MTFQLFLSDARNCPSATMRMSQILAPLSHALDMTEGQAPGHCIRCAYIGTRLGQELGFSGDALNDLYYTLLLKDLGCSSNAARICALYLADDISFKRDFKTIDGSLSSALRFVFAKTGLESGLSERFRAIVNIMQNGGEISRDLIETRCQRGAEIAGKMRFSKVVQAGIMALDEHWDGSGKPEGLVGGAIPREANIALLSQVVDIFHQSEGRDAAMTEVRRRSGGWFDPDIVTAMDRLARDPGFWADLSDSHIEEVVFQLPPALNETPVTEGFLDDVAAAFSDVVDAKSPYTADHSGRVTLYTDMIAEEMGLAAGHRRWLRRGALLHDLGKLGVSNQVLDKPAKLDEAEWQSVRHHPTNGARVLSQIDAFADIAPVAHGHHEKLNGAGYPLGLGGEEISLEVRMVTVADVFDALSAERPYRGPIPIADVFQMMRAEVGSAFDVDCLNALESGMAKFSRTRH